MVVSNKLIIALDNIHQKKAEDIISQLAEFSNSIVFKVNDLIFDLGAQGMNQFLANKNIDIMIDSKWHDIGETTLNYMRKLASYEQLSEKTLFLTIHASNGGKTIAKIMKEKEKLGLKTNIFGVTLLTSFDEEETKKIYSNNTQEVVLRLAKEALDNGIDGIVCSPHETDMLRNVFPGKKFQIMTPGIRFSGGETHDQIRITTPEQAIKNGANHIVMGRPILQSSDITKTVSSVIESIKTSTHVK